MRTVWATDFAGRHSLSSCDKRCSSSDDFGRLQIWLGGSVCSMSVCRALIALLVCGWLVLDPTTQVRVQAGPIHVGTPVFERETARYWRAKGHSQSGGAGAVHQQTIPAQPSRPSPSQPSPSQPSPNRPPAQPELLFDGLGSSSGGLGTGTVPVSSSSAPACFGRSVRYPIPRILWRTRFRDVIHSCYEYSPPLVPS